MVYIMKGNFGYPHYSLLKNIYGYLFLLLHVLTNGIPDGHGTYINSYNLNLNDKSLYFMVTTSESNTWINIINKLISFQNVVVNIYFKEMVLTWLFITVLYKITWLCYLSFCLLWVSNILVNCMINLLKKLGISVSLDFNFL